MYTVFNVKENFSTIYQKHVPQSQLGNVTFLHGTKKYKKEPHPHIRFVGISYTPAPPLSRQLIGHKERRNTKREIKMGAHSGRHIEEEEGEEGGDSQLRRQQKIVDLFQYITSTIFPLFSLPVRLLRGN